MIFRRSILPLALGTFSYLSLHAFPYFPEWWISILAAAVTLLGFFHIQAAMFLAITAFSVTVAYHSFGLFIFLVIFIIILANVTGFQNGPETFLLSISSPLLANLNLFGYSLPFEFATVLLLPALVYGKKIPAIAALSCLWCAIIGIIAKQSMIGNLVIGTHPYSFYYMKHGLRSFYEIGWLFSRLRDPSLGKEIFGILANLINALISHPLIFLQALGWAAASFALGHFLELRSNKNQRRFHIFGMLTAVSILILLQILTLSLYPTGIDFQPIRFFLILILSGMILFGLGEWAYYLENKTLQSRIKPSPADVQSVLQRETVRRQELSLEETLKMQSELRAYIQKKFVRETTALDIDVAESTKLKEGEPPDAILHSFTGYWKMVDLATLSKGGRMLNRAGDGAIYLFGSADQAVAAAKAILQGLDEFNQKTNTLKSPFLIRIGLNTGEIMEDLSKKTGDVFSQVLDISGHLQKMAGIGAILLSENTYQKLSSKSEFEPRGVSEKDGIAVYAYKKT